MQQATEDAQCSAEEGVAVDSQTVQKQSNAERLNIKKVSLGDNLSAQAWSYCHSQNAKQRRCVKIRRKVAQVVLTCFQKYAHDHQENPGSHRKAQKKVAEAVAYNSPLRASATLLDRTFASL